MRFFTLIVAALAVSKEGTQSDALALDENLVDLPNANPDDYLDIEEEPENELVEDDQDQPEEDEEEEEPAEQQQVEVSDPYRITPKQSLA